MSLITCKELTLGYEGHPIVTGLDFTVENGDYLCIVGENGSGKSTLMKTLLGLKEPMSGSITFGDGLRKTEIGYLPQQSGAQKDFPASVFEVVLSGCLNKRGFRPFYSADDKARAKANMERLGIEQLSSRCYRELSGGQQQRVLLARALCATSKLLLLDEPVSGLDPKVTLDMYSLISDLNRREGITVIMISHDISAALSYSTHILHVGHEPKFFGKTADYLNTEFGKAFSGLRDHCPADTAATDTTDSNEAKYEKDEMDEKEENN